MSCDETLPTVYDAQHQASPENMAAIDQVRLAVKRQNERDLGAFRKPLHRAARAVHDRLHHQRVGPPVAQAHDIACEVLRHVRVHVDVRSRLRGHILDDREQVPHAVVGGAVRARGEEAVAPDPLRGALVDDEHTRTARVPGGERSAAAGVA